MGFLVEEKLTFNVKSADIAIGEQHKGPRYLLA